MTTRSDYQKRLEPLERLEGMQFIRSTEFSTLLVLKGLDYVSPKEVSMRSKLFENHYLFSTEVATSVKSLEKLGLVTRTFGKLFKLTCEEKTERLLYEILLIDRYGLAHSQRNLIRFAKMIDRVGCGDWLEGKTLFHTLRASEYMQFNRFIPSGLLVDVQDRLGKKYYKPKQYLLDKAAVWARLTDTVLAKPN